VKANDSIPEDEMLLAEAIAAARSRNLNWCSGVAFEPAVDGAYDDEKTTSCCAIGALALAFDPDSTKQRGAYCVVATALQPKLRDGENIKDPTVAIYSGNDDSRFLSGEQDDGESLGWAYRCAMTQEEP
jgi:hypothetical protein